MMMMMRVILLYKKTIMHSHGLHTSINGQGKNSFKITRLGKFNERIVIQCYGLDLEKITE